MNGKFQSYGEAKTKYQEIGVDVEKALGILETIPISMHCWQGDDLKGFESSGNLSDGGILATGQYPGRARTAGELRQDIEKALSLIPGKHRVALHAIYLETAGAKPVPRNDISPKHFSGWIDWAKDQKLGLDFNPTFFAHPMASSGFTLAALDDGVRQFWVEHGIASRKIGEAIGRALDDTCITNFWIPDGYKDFPADRYSPRQRLTDSLDRIFLEPVDPNYNLDAVESKLFGIGSESYVVGSFEYYLGYSITKNKLLTLDSGHFHPTETITDKISSLMFYLDDLYLHVSRGVRWDSDHVVIYDQQVQEIAQEIIRGEFLNRIHIGLDYFDASINRVAAWVIGMRSVIKALLYALVEPYQMLKRYEKTHNFTGRLAWMETAKTLPFGTIWSEYCHRKDVPCDQEWLTEISRYEERILKNRLS